MSIRNKIILALAFLLTAITIVALGIWYLRPPLEQQPYRFVSTIAGINGEFGEPFGIAASGGDIYVSDGLNGRILRLRSGAVEVFASGLDTPSGITFDKAGNLIVADSGSDTVKSISASGTITNIAGTEGKSGFADGDGSTALFNAPIGVAIGEDGRIFVADTYNDRIRVIDNGKVSTIAGGAWGYADGSGAEAKFFSPGGIAFFQDKLLVADTGNRRIRVVEPEGKVWTLAGDGSDSLRDGTLLSASFVQPSAIAVNGNRIFVVDGNAVRLIAGDVFPLVSTVSGSSRGLHDGEPRKARFNRLSGLAIDGSGDLIIADSDNKLVRSVSAKSTGAEITAGQIEALREKPEDFRKLQPPRWPYDPPDAKREVAGTLGELRGEIKPGDNEIWFHNGLDIAGGYGETARFVRDEKVLRPNPVDNFGNLRESLRMPSMGYIHIRLGRDASGKAFADKRFQFVLGAVGKMIGVRIPRGAKFKAGEPIGTLNPMNHVHLIAGRSGYEMNALDALIFPGISDSRPPTIEKVTLADENWRPLENKGPGNRIQLTGKTRVLVRSFDQVDGNADRRRLGLYKLGYQILHSDGTPVGDTQWTIKFARLPNAASVRLVYAEGSRSGATGETIFNYIVTNRVDGDEYKEDFIDATTLPAGSYMLRAFAADYFGNTTHVDTAIEVMESERVKK